MKATFFCVKLCALIVAAICFLWFPTKAEAKEVKLFVSNLGNDDNVGSRKAPLATLKAAIDRAYIIQKSQESKVNIIIRVDGGEYYLPGVIEIPAEGQPNSMKICGEGIGKTVFTGGVILPPFKEDPQSGLWIIELGDDYPDIQSMFQLFVNDRRAILARTPNSESYVIPISATEEETKQKGQFEQRIFLPDECKGLLHAIENMEDAYVSILHYWDLTRKHFTYVSDEKLYLSITGPSIKRWQYFSAAKTTHLFFENDKSFLDSPGEFCYDKKERKVYYYPLEGEKVENSSAVCPITAVLLRIEGTDSDAVTNVRFEDITFSHTIYQVPEEGENPQQAVATKGAGVVLSYSSGVVFKDCEFCHTGEYALWFDKACSSCEVERCYIHDLGAGGIKIGNDGSKNTAGRLLTNNIKIDNNIIQGGGRTLHPGVGILLQKASDCTITHNDISDFYYTGISLGWVWDFSDSPSKRNSVSYNHIHHLGWGALSDMGGVYTLGVSEGTTISNNVIHDIYCYGYCGNGIFTDQASSYILIRNNLVFRCNSAGFFQNFGRDNTVTNNLFLYNGTSQIGCGGRVNDDNTLKFSNNIIVFSKKNQLFEDKNWSKSRIGSDSNIYWCEGLDNFFNGVSLNDWNQLNGKDEHSLVINPKLQVSKKDFYLVTDKAVLNSIMFYPINFSNVGVYGKRKWKKLAAVNQEREHLLVNLFGSDE